MERIRQLWNVFSSSEKRYLRLYLEAFHKGNENTALRLVQLIDRKPDITQEEASLKLYGKARTQAFSMLKGRLLDRMLDVLSLSINLQNHPMAKEDPLVIAKTHIFKNFLASFLVRKRGLSDLSDELAQKVINQSEALDYPEGLLLSIPIIASSQATQGKPVRALWDTIESSTQQYKNDLVGLGLFEEYRARFAGHSGKEEECLNFLDSAIEDIQQRLEETYSSRAHYYFLNLLVEKHLFENNSAAQREVLFEMLDLVESHEGLRQKNRQLAVSVKLVLLELNSGNFEEAYEIANRGKKLLPFHHRNVIWLHIANIFASFFLNKLEEAEAEFEAVDEDLLEQIGDSDQGIYAFLGAVVAYGKGDIFGAKAKLLDADPLYQDKHGWNLGLRIFDIMLHIDMQKHDLAETMITNLRRHIQRYANAGSRETQIYRFLNILSRSAFHLDVAVEEGADILQKLAESDSWSGFSHEPIPFHLWVDARQQGRKPYEVLMEALSMPGLERPRNSDKN
ncbi:MAG: hypothetical protein AB8F95_10040 [Bacteroidia bacterium]